MPFNLMTMARFHPLPIYNILGVKFWRTIVNSVPNPITKVAYRPQPLVKDLDHYSILSISNPNAFQQRLR